MRTVFPDYRAGLLNLMASVMEHYGSPTPYPLHPLVSEWLAKGYDNVVLFLIDGMGSKIIESQLGPESSLRAHLAAEMTTVYPPTTAAATTLLDSALAPASSGWLGWQQYFREADDHRILFLDQSFYSRVPHEDGVVRKAIGYRPAGRRISDAGHGYHRINPAFAAEGAETLEEEARRILAYAGQCHDTFIYAYWDELDTLMHQVGVNDPLTKRELARTDRIIGELGSRLPKGTLMMVIADHGQLDTRTNDLRAHPDLCACFRHKPGLEQRTTAFYLREGSEETFRELFERYYPEKFRLLGSQEFLDQGYLGDFPLHPRTRDFLGDYIAVAVDDENLLYGNSRLIGQHAGNTEAEMMIPLAIYTGKEKKQ